MDYICNYYHVPAARGVRVRRKDRRGKTGKVMSAHGSHLKVRMDDQKAPAYFHPLDLEYCINGIWNEGPERATP